MDLADHLRTIAANWWRILLVAAVVGMGVFVFSYNLPNTYEAFTLVNVTPQSLRDQNNISVETLQFKVAAFEQVLKSQFIADRAATLLRKQHYRISGATARGRLSVIANGSAGLLGVVASAHSQKEAIAVSSAFGEALVDSSLDDARSVVQAKGQDLERNLVLLQTVYDNVKTKAAQDSVASAIATVQIAQAGNQVDPSQAIAIAGPTTLTNNGSPVAPKPVRDSLIAFLAAFVVVGEGFVIHRAFGDRFAREADVDAITQLTGLPVLARIPRGKGPNVVEAFRTLRTNLMFLEGSGRPRTIAIVSPNPGAGKSFCCVNLGESAVAVDAQVVLVDADLRRPVLHERLHTPREPGLTDTLRGAPLTAALHKVDGSPGMRLIPSGSPVGDTVAALGGRKFRNLLDGLDSAELVIVDTPPGNGYADALAVSAQCDAALLVLDASTTRRRSTKQFVESLERTGASLIGVVLNGAVVSRRDGYYGYDR